jgi:hypothetical protein
MFDLPPAGLVVALGYAVKHLGYSSPTPSPFESYSIPPEFLPLPPLESPS